MKKAVIISDSLGKTENLLANLLIEEWDIVVHLGDYCSDMQIIRSEFSDKKLYSIRSWCESEPIKPYKTVEIENLKFLFVHNFSHVDVSDCNVDVVVYTDPLQPDNRVVDGIQYISTGSFSSTNKSSRYVVLSIDDGQVISCEFKRPLQSFKHLDANLDFLAHYVKKLPNYELLHDFYGKGYSKTEIAALRQMNIVDVYHEFTVLFQNIVTVLNKIVHVKVSLKTVHVLLESALKEDNEYPKPKIDQNAKYYVNTLYEKTRDFMLKDNKEEI